MSLPKRSAFTIVELLVVGSIIAILLAMLLPALAGARTAARRTNEASAARQLMVAYTSYAGINDDRVLPGHMRGLPAFAPSGKPIATATYPTADARYPWRIAPYLDYEMRSLYKNEHEALLDRVEAAPSDADPKVYKDYLYIVSLSPSLGLNTFFVGGDEMYGLAFERQYTSAFGRFYVTSAAEVFHPDRLLVFTSSRGVDPLGIVAGLGVVEGFHRVEPPWFYEPDGCRWTEHFRRADDPGAFGYVSPRYGGQAVTAFFDGHVASLEERSLRDMRHWSNRAEGPEEGIGGER